MQSLKSVLTSMKNRVAAGYAAVLLWVRKHNVIDIATIVAFITGLVALAALIWMQVRPIQVADIKVPVATDQASYYPGEDISGIFFGEIYYRGEVRVLREVFCKDYQHVIAPPASAQNGDFYDTQSIPRKIEGLNVNIGALPEDIPVGSNCVLQFTNVYTIPTIFGSRHVEYQYYTQNFSIVTRERRLQLECEASGRKDCNFLNDSSANQPEKPAPETQSSPDSVQPSESQAPRQGAQQPVTNNTYNTTNNTTNNPPAQSEPAPRIVERCTVDFIVRINCRQEAIE